MTKSFSSREPIYEPIIQTKCRLTFLFRKKLEQAYRLCNRCERILNRTLNKVKQNVLGSKLAQIGSQGMGAFDMVGGRRTATVKRRVFSRLCFYMLIVLAVLNLIRMGQEIAMGNIQLDSVFPTRVTNGILIFASYVSAIQHLIGLWFDSLMSTTWIEIGLNTLNGTLLRGFSLTTASMASILFGSSVGADTSTAFSILQTDTSFMLDLAGILLSIVVLLLNGLKRNGPVIVWLLWSFKMAMPSVENRKIVTDDIVNETLFGLANVTISVAVFIVSLLNTKDIDGTKIELNLDDPNQSVRKICSHLNSDVTDESEDELDVSASCVSQKSFRQRNNNRSNMPLSPKAMHNASLDSTRSFTSSLLRDQMGSTMNLLNKSFDESFMLNRSGNNMYGSQGSIFDDCQSSVSTFRPAALRSQESLYSRNAHPANATSAKRFTSMDNVASGENVFNNDFQIGINGLNISGQTIERPQPSYTSQHRHRLLASSPSQLRQRKQVISPSRFNFNTTVPPQQPLTQASWVAGGYWNSTSPQKKCPPVPMQPTIDLMPIMSRTSSQSSGFESRASSVVNGGSGSGDSEGSICGDAVEQQSVFSETMPNFSQFGNGRSLNLGKTAARSLFETQPMFPITSTLPSDGNVFSRTMNAKPTVYHQFGTQRAPAPPPSFVSTASHRGGGTHSAFTFNKLTNNLPIIEKGSLLRDWKQRSLIDVSQQL